MPRKKTRKFVDIFAYDNYRSYLRDYYSARQLKDSAFTYRSFAQCAGFNSPNFYKLVAEGKRNLSAAGVVKFSKALGLNKREAQYFETLVNLDQEKTTEIKAHYLERLGRIAGSNKSQTLEAKEYTYYKEWYFPVVRELALLKGFEPKPEWIVSVLNRQITKRQATEALAFLFKENFLKKDAHGKIVPAALHVRSGKVVRSLAIRRFHQVMAQKAKDVVDHVPPEERDFSTVTLALSKEEFTELMKDIKAFRKKILEKYRSEKDNSIIGQLNIQLFKLAEQSKKRKPK